MSADNFIAIICEPDGTYTGYNCSASSDYENIFDFRSGLRIFTAYSMESAISMAQQYQPCEYGYRFVNLPEETKLRKRAVRRPAKDKMVKGAPREKEAL